MRRVAAVLTTLALVLVLAPAAGAAPPVVGVQIGNVDGGSDPAALDRQLDLARASGARTVRVPAAWSDFEPARGERDPATLAAFDHLFAGAKARGIRVLLMIYSTPCWASAAPGAAAGDCGGNVTSYPPREPRDLVPIATFLASRYAAQLAAFEIWNEPDQSNQKYFAGPDKVRRYAALTRAVYKPLKRAAPKVPVLAGAFVGMNGRFLRALYKEHFKGSYDALSVHFYDVTLYGIRMTRAVQRAAGDRTPMWVGESGWSSCLPATHSPDGHQCVTRAAQARFTADLLREAGRASYIRGLVIYGLQDSSSDEFGLYDRAWQPKPVLTAMRRALSGRPAALTRTRVVIRVRGSRAVVSGSAAAGDVLSLTVTKNGRAQVRYRFRLDGHGGFSIRLPAALSVPGVSVRLVQGWTRTTASARLR